MFLFTTLTWVVISCPVLLLTLAVAIYLTLARFLIIRTRILRAIRICIFSERRHELTHVLVRTLEPSKLLLKGQKVTILLQNQNRLSRHDIIRRVDNS